MAEPLSIPVIRDPRYGPDDTVEIEVDSETIDGRYVLWDASRRRRGFGFGPFGAFAFGVIDPGLGFGEGVFAGGAFGFGAELLTLKTRPAYDAGDYSVRIRAVDAVGNAGAWSAAVTIQHRPDPPPPRNFRVSGDNLVWTWP